MPTKPAIHQALLSASDKTGLVEFAHELNNLGINILASGGTAKLLQDSTIPVAKISDYTGFPEIMAGRVKTLHPKIHGGLLARRGIDDEELAKHHIKPIDLLVVNLYPFQQTINKPDCEFVDAIENIDIGGPTMLRAAAKNHEYVTVIVDPSDYATVLTEIKTHGDTTLATRRRLATKVFEHTAQYDSAIANYLTMEQKHRFPSKFHPQFTKVQDLRYGENPHQAAAFYLNSHQSKGSLAGAKLLQGKPLSFNNMLDANAALNCVKELGTIKPACVIVKHTTPCAAAIGKDLCEAYQHAFRGDSQSAFGGIIACNQNIDAATAKTITEQQFAEVIIAPNVDQDAKLILANKKNLRVLCCGKWQPPKTASINLYSISGGLLCQEDDICNNEQLTVVTQRKPNEQEMQDLLFAWKVVKHVKSNAIVYAKNLMTLGIGTGQTSRVFSAKIAALKAKEANLPLNQAVMASDAFFPFADGIQVAAQEGIKAIIQPGGSKRDQEVIEMADRHDIAMVMTGIRHFKH